MYSYVITILLLKVAMKLKQFILTFFFFNKLICAFFFFFGFTLKIEK